MGYILPITNYQLMQYANVERAGPRHYAYVAGVEKARSHSRFEKELERYYDRTEIKKENKLPLPRAYVTAPLLGKEMQKGRHMNTYV